MQLGRPKRQPSQKYVYTRDVQLTYSNGSTLRKPISSRKTPLGINKRKWSRKPTKDHQYTSRHSMEQKSTAYKETEKAFSDQENYPQQ